MPVGAASTQKTVLLCDSIDSKLGTVSSPAPAVAATVTSMALEGAHATMAASRTPGRTCALLPFFAPLLRRSNTIEPPPPDGERVLRVLTARLLAMPASAFATSGDAAIPPVPTDELREALSDVAVRYAQAAAVARLACASRASNELAKASTLPAPARAARRVKLLVLSAICAAPRAVELFDQNNVREALVAACARPADAAAADEAKYWREAAAAADHAMAPSEETNQALLFALQAPPAEWGADRTRQRLEWRAQRLAAVLSGARGAAIGML